MKIEKKETTKPGAQRVKYSITGLNKEEYKTIIKGLSAISETDCGALEILKTAESIENPVM